MDSFFPSKSYNLLSGCAQSNLLSLNSTHIESNIHTKSKQETKNYYKGRASGNAGGQERSNSLLSGSPATTLSSQEKWFSASEFRVIAEFAGNSFSNHSFTLAKSHTLLKTHNKSRIQARKQL